MPQHNEDEQAALEVFRSYAIAFGALDAGGVARFFNEPSLLLTPKGEHVAKTRAEIEYAYDSIMREARTRGYASTDFERLEAKSIGAGLVAVSGAGVWTSKGGDVLMRFEISYVLRSADPPRIVMAMIRAVDS